MIHGLQDFLAEHPRMRVFPSQEETVKIKGFVDFCYQYSSYPIVDKTFQIEIDIPEGCSHTPPVIREVGGAFPRSKDFHVYGNGELCLASPLRLSLHWYGDKDLNKFYETFFIPFAYAITLKYEKGIDFIFGDLEHGKKGVLDDYKAIFSVSTRTAAIRCLEAVSKKRRIANKRNCPCGCGLRLGKCSLRLRLNALRYIYPRSRFAFEKDSLMRMA